MYQEEVELNATFGLFIHNYKVAYEGKNTKRDQILNAAVIMKNVPKERKF